MKQSVIGIFIILLAVGLVFSAPNEEVKKEIDVYLKSLSHPDHYIHMNALKQLNSLKNQYPDYNMQEFDNFLKSEIMKRSTDSWLQSLQSDMESIRHSTLSNIVLLKSDFPNLDTSVFNKAVEKMSKSDKEPHLQVDAKIAYMYLNDPQLAASLQFKEDTAPGDVFTQIHTKMHEKFVVDNPTE